MSNTRVKRRDRGSPDPPRQCWPLAEYIPSDGGLLTSNQLNIEVGVEGAGRQCWTATHDTAVQFHWQNIFHQQSPGHVLKGDKRSGPCTRTRTCIARVHVHPHAIRIHVRGDPAL